MSTLKRVNGWWNSHAWGILTITVGLLAFFIAVVWVVNSQQNEQQADRIETLESAAVSLSEALDKQREAAASHGAPVVVPDSEHIREEAEKGEKGDTGAVGPAGPPGSPGLRGPSGPPGEDGENGASGTEGSPGASGSPGPVGPSGSSGQDGVDGANGADGAQGPPGPAGPQGEQGPKGDQGEKGEPGETGPAPSRWTFTFAGVKYTCTPVTEGSTEYSCTGDGPLPDPQRDQQGVSFQTQLVYYDRRWYALKA